jgi:hypothetical protein
MGDQNLLPRAPLCFGRHVKLLVPTEYAVVNTPSSFNPTYWDNGRKRKEISKNRAYGVDRNTPPSRPNGFCIIFVNELYWKTEILLILRKINSWYNILWEKPSPYETLSLFLFYSWGERLSEVIESITEVLYLCCYLVDFALYNNEVVSVLRKAL